jgi:hypothetical protein
MGRMSLLLCSGFMNFAIALAACLSGYISVSHLKLHVFHQPLTNSDLNFYFVVSLSISLTQIQFVGPSAS